MHLSDSWRPRTEAAGWCDNISACACRDSDLADDHLDSPDVCSDIADQACHDDHMIKIASDLRFV